MNKSETLLLIASLFAVLIVAGCTSQTPTQPAGPGCTLETKQCSDGSYVTRQGPNCEFAACPEPNPPAGDTIKTASKQGIANYIVDGNGMTLYYFTRDAQGIGGSAPTSTCIGGCTDIWPVFYAGEIKIPSNLDTNDFSTITRGNGDMQTTYKGWPLYYYYLDTKQGDTIGHGVDGTWYIVAPGTI